MSGPSRHQAGKYQAGKFPSYVSVRECLTKLLLTFGPFVALFFAIEKSRDQTGRTCLLLRFFFGSQSVHLFRENPSEAPTVEASRPRAKEAQLCPIA
jgi:hypothetical protein